MQTNKIERLSFFWQQTLNNLQLTVSTFPLPKKHQLRLLTKLEQLSSTLGAIYLSEFRSDKGHGEQRPVPIGHI